MEVKRKAIPEAEVKLAQELCVQMGECSATYHIVLLLGKRECLRNALRNAANELAVIHDSSSLEVIDAGIQTIAGRACDAARSALNA